MIDDPGNLYSWCYWPDRSAWLAQIKDGFVDESSAVAKVRRDKSGSWSWSVANGSRVGPFGTEPTREDAIEAASRETMRAVDLPPWHPVMHPGQEGTVS